MSDYIITTPAGTQLAVTAAEAATLERDSLLEAASRITSVTTSAEAEDAAARLKDLKGFSRQIETSRKTVKQPVADLVKRIDDLAKELTTRIDAEASRLSRAVGLWQEEEQRKADDAAAAARAEELRISQETAKKIEEAKASGKSEAAIDRQIAKAEDRAFENIAQTRADAASAATPTIAGLAKRTELVVEVTDIKALYAARPECVTLTANLQVIKALVKAGVVLPGITSRNEVKSIVR